MIVRTGDDAFFITGDDVYDAGTEVNDEADATTPLLGQAAPNTGTTEGGVIRQHPGLIGSVRAGGGTVGGALTFAPNGDFTDGNPLIASIQIGGTLDGNDTINGGAGNDTILGSEGDDSIIGGDGDDTVDGGVGNDTIFGNTGVDTLTGNYGDDTIVGGSGDDVLTGNAGNDTIFGGFGDDDIDGGDGDDTLVGGGQIEVTVTNLQATEGGLLTPFVLATQNDTYDFFNVGGTASGSLEALAEDGATGPRIDAALASGGVFAAVATPGGLLNPGDSRTVTFYANPNNPLTQNLSFASMFLPSNDAFIGNDDPTAIPIFDDAGNLIVRTGDDAFFITGDDVYDAGTEVNDEADATTPLLGQAAPNTGTTEGGVIRQHPGLIGSVRAGGGTVGGALTFAPNGDFTDGNPLIASIQIGGTLDGNDTINGGAGNDTILGSEGDDTLVGGSGDDTIGGGDGSDTALFTGDSSEYSFNDLGGSVEVVDSVVDRDGTDVLTDVESTNINIPTLDPIARFPGDRPTLTWNAIPGASSYEVWLGRISPAQSRILADVSVVTTNEFTPPADLDPAFYRFWVRLPGGTWSTPVIFEVQPELVSPLTSTFNARPTFEWEAIPNASGYELFVRTRDSSIGVNGDIVITTIPADATSFTLDQDLPEGPVRWWIRAIDSIGNRGYSAPGTVEIGGRARVTVASQTAFAWENVDGAGRYILFVQNVATGEVVIREDQVTATTFNASQSLDSGNYRAWVKAIDAVTDSFDSSRWSDAFDFSVAETESSELETSLVQLQSSEITESASGFVNEFLVHAENTSGSEAVTPEQRGGEVAQVAVEDTLDSQLDVAVLDEVLSSPSMFALILEESQSS